jgi:hypothetical protein
MLAINPTTQLYQSHGTARSTGWILRDLVGLVCSQLQELAKSGNSLIVNARLLIRESEPNENQRANRMP